VRDGYLIERNGEQQMFEGVYFISKLSANIVNVGRLDEDGYQVLIIRSGELVIREPTEGYL
jgi:hypothetical protein